MKRMLEVFMTEDGRTTVNINYSSLELLQTCLRKSNYYFGRQLVRGKESPALVFGSAIHKAMEVWYSSTLDNRRSQHPICLDTQDSFLHANVVEGVVNHGSCARCASLFAFSESGASLPIDEMGNARTLLNGFAILNAYFDKYLEDPYIVYMDKTGPYIERMFEFEIFKNKDVTINYFGTIDVIWKNVNTGHLYICDHKTTYSLGKDFTKRIKPNFQYTGYIMGATKALNLNTESFIVNAIQVARVKRDARRFSTFRSEEDFKELEMAVRHNVMRYLVATASDEWPQNSPNPCAQYGGCQYHAICEVTDSTRESVIRSLYGTR